MKRLTTFLIALVGILTLVLCNLGVKPVHAEALAPAAELGKNSADSDYYSKSYQDYFGSVRLSDTKTGIIQSHGFGRRAGFKDTYNLNDLTITANMSNFTSGNVLILMFGYADDQPYYSETGSEIVMDILCGDNHQYLVTFNREKTHNVSIEGFTNDVPTIHGSYSGMTVTAENDLVTIKIKKLADTVELSVNEYTASVPTALDGMQDITKCYLVTGMMGGTAADIYYELDVVDADRAAYYSETGAYGVQKALVNAYTEAVNADLSLVENREAAKVAKAQIDFSGLKSYDTPRLASIKETNDQILEDALVALGLEEAKPKPVSGVKAPDSPYFSAYQPDTFGSVRIDDTTVSVTGYNGTGKRGGFVDTYNINSFTTKVNLKKVLGSEVFVLMLNNDSSQSWYSENGCGIGMDILKKDTNEHDYIITLFIGGHDHNISIEGFTGGQAAWRGDYKGICVNAADDVITINYAVEGDNVTITVNEVSVTLAKAVVFEKIINPESVYVCTGIMSGPDPAELYVYDISVSDAATEVYYSETGAYGAAKVALDAYTASLEADLTNIENVRASMALRDAVVLAGIKEYDLPRLQPTKEANDAILNAAMEALHMNDKAPVAETTEVSHRLDKEDAVQVTVNLFESELLSVKVDETTLETAGYEYAEGVLSIKASALADLTAGTHNIVVTTNGGSCTIILTVQTKEEFIPTIVETSVEHQLGTAADITVHVDTKGNAIETVTVDGQATTEFAYANGVLTINNVYVEDLEAGTYTVVVTTADGEVSFEMILNAAANPSDREPVMGEYGNDVNWYSLWQSGSFGAVRTGDLEMKLVMTSNFGFRGGYRNTFDATNFEGSFDLSEFGNNAILMAVFTSLEQKYFSETNNAVYLEIVKMNETTFFVAFGNPTLSSDKHAASYPGFADGTSSDKPGFSGITVTSDTGEVNFKLVLNEDKSVTITVNNVVYTIANAFDVLPDPTNVYLQFAGMTDTQTIQKVTVNYMLDAKLKEYYSETGAFGIAKAKLVELLNAIKTLNTADEVYAAIELKDSIDVKGLYAHDYNYIKADYERACEILDRAIVENPEILTSVARTAIDAAVKAANDMTSLADEADVLELITIATDRINALKGNENISADVIAELETTLAGATTTRETKIKEYVTAQFNEYVDSVENIVDVETMKTSIQLKNQISYQYEELFTEDEWNTLVANKASADMKLAELVSYSGTDWTVDSNYINVLEKDGEFHIVNLGSTMVYNKEVLDATNLDIELTNLILSTNVGSWLSFGIMEKPELFVNAEDETVQDNKGLVFLMTYSDPTHITVELYIITLMSGGFLGSKIQETIVVDITNGLKFHMGIKEVTISGVTGNYIDIRFNDTELTSLINPAQFQISLGQEQAGYLNISASGSTSTSPISYTIKSINGHKLTDETLVKEHVPTPPTSTESSKEFVMGTTATVSYPVNTYGLEITKVIVGGAQIKSTDYTFANNYLAFKNAFLKTLEKGTYKIEVHTEDGKVELTLVVKAATTDKPAEKGCSCSGAVLVTAMASIVTIAAASIVLLKKREY